MDRKVILVFGVGELQQSIIRRAKAMSHYVVGIDPSPEAFAREECDAFEIVGGQDFETTCAVVEKYGVNAIVTAATDKPLVMMARIAEKYGFPFFSVETAEWSTDKYLMKQRFEEGDITHARGRLIKTAEDAEGLEYPMIVKPRDNSGSRGVKLCRNREELVYSLKEAFEVSKKDTVLVEEFIEGQEYSIESLHYNGKHQIIQFTEKTTTDFPYNVELQHIQPADISDADKEKIKVIIDKIGKTLKFENCPSHTELKINDRGIFVIETSPRLGGDYITSVLTPLSTGINIEEQLIHLALGEEIYPKQSLNLYSGIRFFSLPEGCIIRKLPNKDEIVEIPEVMDFSFSLNEGDRVNIITSSINRYGHISMQTNKRAKLIAELTCLEKKIKNCISRI